MNYEYALRHLSEELGSLAHSKALTAAQLADAYEEIDRLNAQLLQLEEQNKVLSERLSKHEALE